MSQFHIFKKQEITFPELEPFCVAASSNNIFWVALSEGKDRLKKKMDEEKEKKKMKSYLVALLRLFFFFLPLLPFKGIIRGYPTENLNHLEKLFEFKAVWPSVVSLHYISSIQRIITLEQKDQRRVCRIYHLFSEPGSLFLSK